MRRLGGRPFLTRGLVTIAVLGATALSFGLLGSSPAAPDTTGANTTAATGDSGNTGTAGVAASPTTTTTTAPTSTTTTTAPATTTTTAPTTTNTAPTTTAPATAPATTTPTGPSGAVPNLRSASPSIFNDGTVTWTGNGAEDGHCDTVSDDSIGPVPNGETGWLFILTQPGSAPYELTTNLGDATGTQEGNGSIHFVLFTTLNGTLTTASAVTGTDGSVLTVSHCYNGAPLLPTTITTTVDDAISGVQWTGGTVGATAYDTSSLGGVQEGTPLTGTVTYTFFTNGSCDGDGTPETVDIVGGMIPHSPPTITLAAGSYSYEAVYNGDPNYAASPVGTCEPFSVGPVPSSTATVLDDAATSQPWTGQETVGARAFDTSTVSGGIVGFPPTGTETYTLFDNGTCTQPVQPLGRAHVIIATKTVTLNPDGTVPPSATTAPLLPGSYSFDASYSGDTNYDPSGLSECEPFSVGQGPTTTATSLKDAATNQDWAGTETVGATAYDTSTVSGEAGGIVPTGTVTYSYFTNGTCSGMPVSTQTVTLNQHGMVPDSTTTASLVAGSYSFDAIYGGDDNYAASAISSCEPFTVGAVTPSSSPTSGPTSGPVTSPATSTTTNTTPTTPPATAPAATSAATPTAAPTSTATSPATAPSTIAFTGADLAGMGAGGAALLGLGGLLVLSSRRRRGQSNEAEEVSSTPA